MTAKLLFILSLLALPVANTMAMGSHRAMQQESAGQYVDNSLITIKVKSRLLADPDLKALAISVSSYKGQVKLSGYVDTAAQKDKAAKLAKQVDGVTMIHNELMVKKMHN